MRVKLLSLFLNFGLTRKTSVTRLEKPLQWKAEITHPGSNK